VSSLKIRPQVHDLIRTHPASFKSMDAPAWVNKRLSDCPWVVVRRARAPTGMIAVGVRGDTRSERWGGVTHQNTVEQIVEPNELLRIWRTSTHLNRTPPIQLLEKVIERWQGLALPWGPTGSVGLELASGYQVTTPLSDLDIAIRAPQRLSLELARSLWERVMRLRPKVDVRVETSKCGFALEEYVRQPSSRILLHYPDGARVGDDPWGESPPVSPAVS
jgi:phosphoribosyl-dephospho-CoA transferase